MINSGTALIGSPDRQLNADRPKDVVPDHGFGDFSTGFGDFSTGAVFARAMSAATKVSLQTEIQQAAENISSGKTFRETETYVDDHHPDPHHDSLRDRLVTERESHSSESDLNHNKDHDTNAHDHQTRDHRLSERNARVSRDDNDQPVVHEQETQRKTATSQNSDSEKSNPEKTALHSEGAALAGQQAKPQPVKPDAQSVAVTQPQVIADLDDDHSGDPVPGQFLPGQDSVQQGVDNRVSAYSSAHKGIDTPPDQTHGQAVEPVTEQTAERADTVVTGSVTGAGLLPDHDVVHDGVIDVDTLPQAVLANTNTSDVADHANGVAAPDSAAQATTGNRVNAAGFDSETLPGPEVVGAARVNPTTGERLPGQVAPPQGPAHQGLVDPPTARLDVASAVSTPDRAVVLDFVDSANPATPKDGVSVATHPNTEITNTEITNIKTAKPEATKPEATKPEATNPQTLNRVATPTALSVGRNWVPGPVVEGVDPGRSQPVGDLSSSTNGLKESTLRVLDTSYNAVAASGRSLPDAAQREKRPGDIQNVRIQGIDARIQVTSDNSPPPRPVHTLATALVAQEIPQQAVEKLPRGVDAVLQPRPEAGSLRASGSAENNPAPSNHSVSSFSPSALVGSKAPTRVAGGSGSQISGSEISGIRGSGGGLHAASVPAAASLPTGSAPVSGAINTAGSPLIFPLASDLAFPANGVTRPLPSSLPGPAVLREQIAVHIHKAAAKGMDRVSIQLKPAELGRVEVHLEMRADHRTAVTVLVERPETLDLLQRDVRGLEQSLRDAGLKTDSGTLQFSMRGERDGENSSKQGEQAENDDGSPGQNDQSQRRHAMNPASELPLSIHSEGRLNLVV